MLSQYNTTANHESRRATWARTKAAAPTRRQIAIRGLRIVQDDRREVDMVTELEQLAALRGEK